MKKKRYASFPGYYIYLFFLLLLFSCSPDENEPTVNDDLAGLLWTLSEGRGSSYFLLPSSTDYSAIPQDINNPLTEEKVALGQLLFHETGFALEGEFPITMGTYSCASCHHARAGFQSGLLQGLGEGGDGFGLAGEGRFRNMLCETDLIDVQPIRTPTALNSAYQPLMLWNGQFGATSLNAGTESQWTEGTPKAVNKLGFEGVETQAIAGLDVHRMKIDAEQIELLGYKALFDNAFSSFPEAERYSTITAGLAIAAFERTLLANDAPFQKYLRGDAFAMSEDEKEGAVLFFGKGRCATCHTGPALNDMNFYALGMNEFDPNDVFRYDPNDPARFGRYSFTHVESDRYKFKTPQLYNLKDVSFYGHGGSFQSMFDLVFYKNQAVAQNAEVPVSQLSTEFVPLGLTNAEITKISNFILNSLYDPNLIRYEPEALPSGNCFPNNDEVSQVDLGCN